MQGTWIGFSTGKRWLSFMIQIGQCVRINCLYSTAICLAILCLFSEHLDQVTVRKNVSHSKSQNSVLFRLWFLQWLRLILMQKSWNQFIVSFQQILLRLPGILLFQCTCGKILRVNCRDALDYWESGNSKQLVGQKIGLVRFYELESNTESQFWNHAQERMSMVQMQLGSL